MSNFKEIEIEDFIWSNISKGGLNDRGLYIRSGLVYRQLNIPGAGIMDMVSANVSKFVTDSGATKHLIVEIYELKRDIITCAHLGQIARYIDCVKANRDSILKRVGLDKSYTIEVRGTLVGSRIERDAQHLINLFGMQWDGIKIVLFEYTLDRGIVFNDLQISDNIHSIDDSSIPNTSFFRIARCSAPAVHDWRTVNNAADGSQSSDLDFLLPNTQSHE